VSDPVTFPIDMQAYAQECMDAWQAGDTARVDFLTSPMAKEHLAAIPDEYRGDDWVYDEAQGGLGSVYLTWRNVSGDQMVYRFLNPGFDPDPGPAHQIRDVIWNP
jgi:hypothetical protein